MTADEYLKKGKGVWFVTGKKSYTIQAMMVSKAFRFYNELEAADYTVWDDGVTVILKGRGGEMWAAGLSKVVSTYTKPDGSALTEADFAVRDVFIDVLTIPAVNTNFAMFVPLSVSLTVETAGGDALHTNLPDVPHGDGDFLVCRADADGKPDLKDVWVVNGAVFPQTYDTTHMIVKS